MEDKLYLENIEEYVYDMDKIVTYKWLAMTLSVPFSEATRMLSEFVQQHSATPSSKPPIYIVYLITGVSRDMNNEKITVSLADEKELEEIKAGLDEMISVIVYSIQKGDHLKDRSSLHRAEHELLQENLHKYSDLCSVFTQTSTDDQHSTAGSSTTPSLPMEMDQHAKQDDQVDKPDQQAKGNKKIASNKTKPKGIAAMFAAAKQPKNATQKPSAPDKPTCKQEEAVKMLPLKDSSKTTTNNNVEKSTQSSMKNSTGIITDSKFDKDIFTTEDDDIVMKDEESKRFVTSNPVTAQAKEQKGKNKKRRRVCQELSSEESDEDSTGTNVVMSDKPLVQSLDQAAVGTKRRKIVRKLVDKMYVDDDGSMVTEKEWQEISTDDDDDEPVVATSNKTKTISSVKAKPKQSTLTAFFHRK